MSSEETRERVLDAAERCFGEAGYAATTLRDVTAAADVNIAAVNYHFDSKEGLFRAVIQRAIDEMTERRKSEIAGLMTKPSPPSPTALMEAAIAPMFDTKGALDDRDRSIARLLARVMTERDPEARDLVIDAVLRADEPLLEGMRAQVAGLSDEEFAFRCKSVLSVVVLHQLDRRPQGSDDSSEDDERRRRWLVGFIAAGMSAPPTASS
jgi:AcrR family transcriptional regulator